MKYNADWAIANVGPKDKSGKIVFYRTYKVWDMPGLSYLGNAMDISRDNMVELIDTRGKKVITVYDRKGELVPGKQVRLTRKGYLRTDPNDIEEDNLENLPTIEHKNTFL